MNLFGFDIDWKNLSKKQIVIFATSLLVTFSIVVGAFTMNSDLFKGDAGGASEDTEVNRDQECLVVSTAYIAYVKELESTLDAFNTGVSVVVDDEDTIEGYKVLASGLLTLISSVEDPIESDCIQIVSPVLYDSIEDLPETVPGIVDLINDIILEFNALVDGCDDCNVESLSLLNLIFSCSSELVYDETTQRCKAPPAPVCGFTQIYSNIVLANTLLDSKKNTPNSFSETDQSTLRSYLQTIDTLGNSSLFRSFITNFNYQQQGTILSQRLASLVTEIKALDTIGACSDIKPITVVQVAQVALGGEAPDIEEALNGTRNGNLACPANSILDEELNECYCPLIDNYILRTESCGGTSNDVRSVPTEEPDLVCPNGIVVDKISDCELFKDDDKKSPNNLPEDPSFDAKDLPGEEKATKEDKEEDDDEDEKKVVEANNEPPVNTTGNANNTQQPTLITNTNANILGAGIVQGNTGPGIWFAIIVAFLATYGYAKITKKN